MIIPRGGDRFSLMIGRKLGRYRLIEKLGEGGMGVVYRAADERLQRDVALKVLPAGVLADEHARNRFQREARALSQLNHPNIATAYDFDTADGIDFLVMEYVEGQSLDSVLRHKRLSSERVIQIGRELASGLQAAHARQIVHRDLKPANLRVTGDGRLKILDFGIAKLVNAHAVATDSTITSTAASTVAGTLPYMAPEQIRGEAVDARADIYSAGAVMYELMAGRRAFDAPTAAELTSSILRDNPPPLRQLRPDVPAGFERVITKCLAKDPAQRYQSAAEMNQALDGVGTVRRTRVLVMAMAALALVLAAVATWRVSIRRTAKAGPVSLAVLPFRVLNDDAATHLGVGIPDALITRLANIRKIRVRSTNSILRYETGEVDARQVGTALACDYLLTGTIQHTTDRYRINVQLLRANDGSAMWGKVYEPARTDLLQLQDELSEQLVSALSVQLSAEERDRVYRRYTSNAEAYDLYLKGRSELARRGRPSIGFFDAALRVDEKYALAHAGKAIACAVIRIGTSNPNETGQWEKCAREEAQRALSLDPNLAEAHEAMAAYHRWSEFEWEDTIRESDAALSLNPSLYNPHRYRGDAFRHMGLLDLVESEVRAARENNPGHNPEDIGLTTATALWDGRYSDAANARTKPDGPVTATDAYVANALFYMNQPDRAISMLMALHAPTVGGRRADAGRASFLAAMGRKAEAQELLNTVTSTTYKDHHLAYAIGAAYAQLGSTPQAMHWLRKAVGEGFVCYPWYARDRLLKPLGGDPEFQQMMRQMRTKWEENKARYGSKTAAPL
jgi:eukaryotic-like serine/threonine-protein kinase